MSKPTGYAVVGIYPLGGGKPQLMTSHGKIVLFDTREIAQGVIPLLGAGRRYTWSADGDTITFLEVDPAGVNRAVILTEYDPYDLPPGMPVPSETRLMDWRNHVMWSYVFTDCGQMQQQADGTWLNLAA